MISRGYAPRSAKVAKLRRRPPPTAPLGQSDVRSGCERGPRHGQRALSPDDDEFGAGVLERDEEIAEVTR